MTIKTKILFLKKRVKVFFTRARFIHSYKTKKRLLTAFLLLNNIYILSGVFGELRTQYEVIIRPTHYSIVRQTEVVQQSKDEPVASEDDGDGVTIEQDTSVSVSEEGDDPSPSLSIEEKIRKTFPEEPEVMVAIAKAESKLNPHVVNRANKDGSVDVGIFQINSIHGYDEEWLKNEDNNIKVARQIYEKQGKNAWVVYWKGHYTEWL
jgi:hypothetical protein